MQRYWAAFVEPLQITLLRMISFTPRLCIALVLFFAFYVLAALVRKIARRSLEGVRHVPWAIRILVGRALYLSVLMIGILTALSAINVNVTAVVEGLGLAGLALGFALKDILENFLAGILLLFARPFELKDQVTLGSYEGTVVDIQIRTTTLLTYANETVFIPNSQVYTGVVVNHTRSGRRRYTVDFETSLDVDTDTVGREALRAIGDCAEILAEPAPAVALRRVRSGDDALGWQLFYWAAPTKATEVATMSEALHRIKIYLFDAGISTPAATSKTIIRRAMSPREMP